MNSRALLLFASGAAAAMLGLSGLAGLSTISPVAADEAPADPVPALTTDVQTLKDKAPDQAHAMVSVAYHFNNLWFAAEARNWPLAEFYWNETRSHMRWAVRIIPVRKGKAGNEIKLGEILAAAENSPLAQLHEAIVAQDHDKFVAAYRFSLEACYACHKAAEKPFLRPRIPERPAEPTINFDPAADWP
ncbi:MAG: hypothetical protein K1X74_13015 [Pirellulales bacterium]|nr:hypothetical protein [Pirellulales bacterium]